MVCGLPLWQEVCTLHSLRNNGPRVDSDMETVTERASDQATQTAYVSDPHSPLRSELFGLEGLEQHARHLAHSARLMPRPFADRRLFHRFAENGRELTRVYHRIVEATRLGQPVSTDAEWLFDNFHIVEDTLREVKHDLPSGYYHRLPKLADGPYAGLPRVYALGIELIAHTDSCLDEGNIAHFVRAYQSVAPLTIGELWAIAIMLRVGLIENLRCLSHQMLHTWGEREKAESCIRQMIPPEGPDEVIPPPPTVVLPQNERDWTDPLMLRLLQGLREHGPLGASAVEWLEKVLERRGDHATELSRREYQRQAANQVSVGNCVTSLRLLSSLDWTTFFENVSLVEQILHGDPARVYPHQDASTRDRYRREVERLARGSTVDEFAVARHAIRLAEEHAGGATLAPTSSADLQAKSHVGYYLVDHGIAKLEQAINYKPDLGMIPRRWVSAHPAFAYFGLLAILWSALVVVAVLYTGAHAAWNLGWLAVAAAAVALPASEIAAGLANDFFTRKISPRVLSKLESKERLPADCPTFVVIPTLLLQPESGPALAERLEIHYLSNSEPQFRFALLTDFSDAQAEHELGDKACLDAAIAAIKSLNERYGNGDGDRFFLFHRRRQWNPAQNCWMGWERKRGKLAEFNRLLRGATDTSFSFASGSLDHLPRTRFVITLDTDTQLPREMGRRLVATLAHPLNQPRFDPAARRVVEGYGILQPRVSFSLRSALRSRFSKLMASSAGIDPYSAAVSDVYQDLFAIGSFTGKGIYDVDAFEAAAHVFPENSILSHDLIEGNFARCGLVTDVEFLDEFPPQYHAFARREHRWVRGDWQILPWLFPRVPTATGDRAKNPLPLVERWKMFDNLRRSLVPPATLVLLALGWTVLPGSPWFWTLLALATPLLPCILLAINSSRAIFHRVTRGGELSLLLYDVRDRLISTAAQSGLAVVFLADQAAYLVDAIARTLVRLFVTHRKLLEWETAASAEGRLGNKLAGFFRTMWPAMLIAVALSTLVAFVHPAALFVAAPVLIAWGASPLLAYWVSGRSEIKEIELTVAERLEFRRIARKTWEFFETHVGAEDNWLPLDNYQEAPKAKAAHRTSPTNIGLYALSALAAHDLGFVSAAVLCDRLERCFDTLDKLDRFHGHFHNWYDTQSLQVLHPDYVSSVDSGNMLGCLIALGHGLAEKADAKLNHTHCAAGLADTFRLVEEAASKFDSPPAGTPQIFLALQQTLANLRAKFADLPREDAQWDAWRQAIEQLAEQLVDQGTSIEAALGQPLTEFQRWAARLLDTSREFYGETDLRHENDVRTHEHASQNGHATTPATSDNGQKDASLRDRLLSLRDRSLRFATEMDFRVLYNTNRDLFSVGFNLSVGRLDTAHYDLLASESCLTSFLAIARGDAPKRHWLQLGRPLTQAAGGIALVSWGGTMFEYLMPRLLLSTRRGTLLNESWQGAVDRQIDYGDQRHVPWGISESGFNRLDPSLDYQYQSFGVPGLGLKRGLGRDLVISPYSTALAVSIRPRKALENFRRLTAEGGEGALGYYEAIDFTRDRVPKDRRSSVVQSYMAHHQGMSLVAITNCLLDDIMPRRLAREPMVKATDLLLEERMPHAAPLVQPDEDQVGSPLVVREESLPKSRRLRSVDTPHPRIHLYSNGHYSVMVTAAGGGFSGCDGIEATRWKEDATCDAWGQFCYIQDLTSGLLWSTGHQPICRKTEHYEVTFSTDKAELRRRDGDIETLLEITVSPESPVEVRRITLTNHDNSPHEVQLTSYAEISLAPRAADAAHPAFSKLFIETEYIPGEHAILCRRRPRSASDKPIYAVHAVAVDCPTTAEAEHETDRKRFLGRGRTAANPWAIEAGNRLSGTTGPVLDPIVSLRERVSIPPGASVSVAFSTAVVWTREEALTLADQYHDFHAVTRAFELAWAQSQVQLRHLTITDDDVHLFQRLAAHVVFAGNTLSASPEALQANQLGQSGLWRFGISGDKPIVLAHLGPTDDLSLVRQLLLAHGYWRLLGFSVDLVILNEHPGGYFEDVQRELQELVRGSESHDLLDKPGGIFLRKGSELSPDDQLLLQAAARVVLASNRGTLARQVDRQAPVPLLPPPLVPRASRQSRSLGPRHEISERQFENSYGGFSAEGHEYVIGRRFAEADPKTSQGDQSAALTPAPWANVIANAKFGTIVTESGGGYTWNANSQLNRLTTWSNDPVSDPPSEIVYLRDEATGEVWTITPAPLGDGATNVRHGQGYTQFESSSHGLEQELLIFVPQDDPLKIVRLTLRNRGTEKRQISATSYTEWVLGALRERARLHVSTEIDSESDAIFATNAFRDEFASGVAFADVNVRPRTATGDRMEFIGRNGSLAQPAALRRVALSNRTGAGFDPCAALMATIDLEPGDEKSVVFLLGEATDREHARRLALKYRDPAEVTQSFDAVRQGWRELLSTIEVATPDAAFNLMLNQWLVYQVLACRVWGRSGFYQSGGAFGFRDQLQDCMALVYAAPAETRAHLLRAASRQFTAGDAQHWWHPPSGRGVRTRCSDDFLWLPFAAMQYASRTGDVGVWDEQVPFLESAELAEGQDEDYNQPAVSSETATLYDHCARAVERGFRFGPHGLPLMGSGDWNDGMNRVGAGGVGESIWNAWFQLAILRPFAELARLRGDEQRAARALDVAQQLKQSLDQHAWDGEWYLRAFFDDGTPLGSTKSPACQIDSIAQSWAVISGEGGAERSHTALDKVQQLLVRLEDRMILLFTPPFNHDALDPGYIKGYVPGIRENGGQYTHAATWVVLAAAMQGQGDRAVELFGLLNPIHHGDSQAHSDEYQIEPYAMAGDVYGEHPHRGRGGWSWYTGAAGWLYRVGLESILGFQLHGDRLRIEPCIASGWPTFRIKYRYRSATYDIRVNNPRGAQTGVRSCVVDGQPQTGEIELQDDGRTHIVEIEMD